MVGSGDGALLLSLPRSSILWVRAGQWPAVFAVGVGGDCLDSLFSPLSFLFSPPLSGRRLCLMTFSTKVVRSYFADPGRGLKVRTKLFTNR